MYQYELESCGLGEVIVMNKVIGTRVKSEGHRPLSAALFNLEVPVELIIKITQYKPQWIQQIHNSEYLIEILEQNDLEGINGNYERMNNWLGKRVTIQYEECVFIG